METLEFSLVRKWFLPTYTIGKLSVDGNYLCDTLEDVVRDLHDINHDGDFNDLGEGKVYGETAIPYGRYQIEFTYWSKHSRMVPILRNVPGFTGILIHGGVTSADTQGCILVGENKIKGGLLYSRYWCNNIELLIREALAEKKEVWIKITA
jgi:hypothetical protein